MAPTHQPKKHSARRPSTKPHRSTLSLTKTQIVINIYDLLPPGKLSSVLWTFGSSLLHSGVVIRDREYAYGGHDHRGLSGVYWTKPRLNPPGGTFRCEILQGFTLSTDEEIEAIIKEVSEEFLGPSYNLLSRNCNHFTNALCQRMTSRPAPNWLNRAASIGIALPCVVPREWISPPDHDTADGELVEDQDSEHAQMLPGEPGKRHSLGRRSTEDASSSRGTSIDGGRDADREHAHQASGRVRAAIRDTSGRLVPASERAPSPEAV